MGYNHRTVPQYAIACDEFVSMYNKCLNQARWGNSIAEAEGLAELEGWKEFCGSWICPRHLKSMKNELRETLG